MKRKLEWKEKRISLGGAIVLSAVLAVVGAVVGMNLSALMGGGPYFGTTTVGSVDWSSELNEVYDKLTATYNGEIDTSALIEGAKSGMVSALGDVYTVYMGREETSDFYDDLHGNVGSGIGVEIGERDGYVRVLRTLPDNPAQKAGILAGDIIYKVDDEEVWTWSSTQVASKMRGDSGTEVKVAIVRDGKEMEFTMKRETINNVSEYVEYDGSTAIITVTRFDNDTGRLVQQEAAKFASKGIDKVILDLRSNGGGYVNAAQDLLSLWIDGKKVFVQKSLHYGVTTTSAVSGKAILANIETVVLVNGSTASASEIVAGALQDYGKATVVGEKTYGKGVVQSLFSLSNGTTLKVTTAEWYTPNDRSISGEGIEPDIEVERSYDDINAMRDPQMDKAKDL